MTTIWINHQSRAGKPTGAEIWRADRFQAVLAIEVFARALFAGGYFQPPSSLAFLIDEAATLPERPQAPQEIGTWWLPSRHILTPA